MTNPSKNTPQLRFPGFEGEWENKKLGEISVGVMYGMNAAAISFDGENKYLRITDIDENTRKFTPNPLTSPDCKIERKYKLKEGDIVFTRTGASVGKSYLYDKNDGNLFFAGFLIKFTITNENPYFIFTETLRDTYNQWVQLMSMRSGQPGINAEEYKTLSFFLPSLPEQTRIASFLTSVDEKLTQLKKKKDLLEQYKKGVMQKIFSQEIRFKQDDGSDFPEWEEKKLGEIAEKIGDGLHGTPKYSENTGYYFINGNNLVNGKIVISGNTKEITFKEFSANDKGLTQNTLLISINGTIGNIAKYCGENVMLGKSVGYFIFSQDCTFFYHLLQSASIQNHFFAELTGTTIQNLSLKTLREAEISTPCLAEQTKIANFLSAIDEKISHCSNQIEKMKLWKKGLLQKMFC